MWRWQNVEFWTVGRERERDDCLSVCMERFERERERDKVRLGLVQNMRIRFGFTSLKPKPNREKNILQNKTEPNRIYPQNQTDQTDYFGFVSLNSTPTWLKPTFFYVFRKYILLRNISGKRRRGIIRSVTV